MVVLDIGANIGYYTLLAARLLGGSGRVISFEPVPSNYALLLRNIDVNGYKNIEAVPRAVSNTCGMTTLYLDKINFGGHSFSQENMPVTEDTVEVETTTLDNYLENEAGIEHVDFIKTDAQGAEGLIFEGAEKTLRSNDLRIMMEFWPFGLENMGTDPMSLIERIRDFGFRIQTVEDANEPRVCGNPEELIDLCRRTADGRGDIILLLDKES
jgi:FkbM family methyltransferase